MSIDQSIRQCQTGPPFQNLTVSLSGIPQQVKMEFLQALKSQGLSLQNFLKGSISLAANQGEWAKTQLGHSRQTSQTIEVEALERAVISLLRASSTSSGTAL